MCIYKKGGEEKKRKKLYNWNSNISSMNLTNVFFLTISSCALLQYICRYDMHVCMYKLTHTHQQLIHRKKIRLQIRGILPKYLFPNRTPSCHAELRSSYLKIKLAKTTTTTFPIFRIIDIWLNQNMFMYYLFVCLIYSFFRLSVPIILSLKQYRTSLHSIALHAFPVAVKIMIITIFGDVLLCIWHHRLQNVYMYMYDNSFWFILLFHVHFVYWFLLV